MTSTTRPKKIPYAFSRKAFLIMGVSALTLGALQPVAAQDETSDVAQATVDTARPYVPSGFSSNDAACLLLALSAFKVRMFAGADSLAGGLTNPVARKIVTWTISNNDGNIYSFAALDAARRDLWGWPRESKRQIAAEKLIGMSGMTAQQIVDWFKGAPPQTTEGASALITAYGNLARTDEARALAKSWWRTQVFDSMAQANFYQAFGSYLTPDDHRARLLCLEVNFQNANSQTIRDMTAYVGQHDADVANAVVAMRTGAASSDGLYQAALAGDPHNPALAFARAK